MKKNCLIWFRKDLRLYDNPALDAAKNYKTIYPLFIMDDDIFENKFIGGASIWWLENSLVSLNKNKMEYDRDEFAHNFFLKKDIIYT